MPENPFELKTREAVLAELDAESSWLNDASATPPTYEDAYSDLALLTEEEWQERKKRACKRLKLTAPALDKAVKKRRVSESKPVCALGAGTTDAIRLSLSQLLLTTNDERRDLGLPISQEAADQRAEELLWEHAKKNAQVFCTDSGLGYLLFHDAKDKPIPVTHDGHELNDFLTNLGIHAGSRMRKRLGKHLGAMCWREGTRTNPRVSFHYNPDVFTAYFAEGPGQLIKITTEEITRVDNGTDGQLFLFPRDYEPWQLDLAALPPLTDFSPDLNALLPELLFNVLEFENESLDAEDIHVLLNSYIATLFLPGIVSGRLLLEILGETGSAKTLFLRLLGKLIYGKRFEVTGMDTNEKEVENALINNSYVVFDDVKRTSNAAILGMIRRACTGGSCKRRELYSTFGQVEEPYRASVAITCSDEPFTATDEMNNRALIIRAKQRTDYGDEIELLNRIVNNRNQLMAEMMVRLQNAIVAVKAQRNFKPKVKMRMASFATFLLRVGRHWDWGPAAEQVLDAWREEQEGAGLDTSIVEVLNAWLATTPTAGETKHYTAGELCHELELQAHKLSLSPWWENKNAALIRAMRRGSHAYQRHFGFCFKARTSGPKAAEYWFKLSDELLAEVKTRGTRLGPGASEPVAEPLEAVDPEKPF